MGNPKLKWTLEEEEAITAAVAKLGTGQWKNILKDPEFAPRLANRSNVQLKDKWRSMRNRSAVNKITSGAVSNARAQNAAASLIPVGNAVGDPSKRSLDLENATMYKTMIFEAISSIKDPNGSNSGAIVGFIERKYKVPQNFRKLMISILRRLVLKGKLDKVQDRYKIKDAALGTDTPMPKEREVQPSPSQNSPSIISEKIKDASAIAAQKIAEAQNKSLMVAEAVKEAGRISEMAEDADSVLLYFKEILEQCSQGKTFILP
ncbi:telomere repeat-binding factor 4-like [Olea europaea subsp. europaea]|uniref:MYB transcription factor n=1 Tax=Olea europaea subsp. europaea TaxID=158383 RepID=A0A8S0QBX3_OLEEU|nr:telomere repeat-binding factor 4-like [Olea europaea subsp. europaea]